MLLAGALLLGFSTAAGAGRLFPWSLPCCRQFTLRGRHPPPGLFLQHAAVIINPSVHRVLLDVDSDGAVQDKVVQDYLARQLSAVERGGPC